MLLLLGVIWGGSFFFARVAVQAVPPMTLVLLRVALAALALHVYLLGRGGLYRELARNWRAFLVMGLLNNAIPHTLIFAGETQIGAGLAAILNATTPLWTVIVTHRLTADEKLRPAKVAGCALGLAGTVLLIGPDALSGAGRARLGPDRRRRRSSSPTPLPRHSAGASPAFRRRRPPPAN